MTRHNHHHHSPPSNPSPNLADAQLELKRLVAVARAVELLAVGKRARV